MFRPSDTVARHELEYDEDDQSDVDPDRCSKPPAETDRRPGQKFGHGLHPRSSAIPAARRRCSHPLESNLTAAAAARNATREAAGRSHQRPQPFRADPWSEPEPACYSTSVSPRAIPFCTRAPADGFQLSFARRTRVKVELGPRSYEIVVVSRGSAAVRRVRATGPRTGPGPARRAEGALDRHRRASRGSVDSGGVPGGARDSGHRRPRRPSFHRVSHRKSLAQAERLYDELAHSKAPIATP